MKYLFIDGYHYYIINYSKYFLQNEDSMEFSFHNDVLTY